MATDLPLLSQFWTASRLNVSSNLRRGLTAVVFMGFLVYCSPYSPSVNSKQPQLVPHGERVFFPVRQPPPLVMKEYWRLNYPLCRLPPRLSNIQKPNDNKASNHVHQP